MSNLVSVIIPTYNRAEFIETSVKSVLQQSHTELECIIIDGGSDDGTRELLDGLDDDRLQLHVRDGPKGIANARNFGIRTAQGGHIVFLDDDDRMYPNTIARLMDTIDEHPSDCAGVFTAQRHVDESGGTQIREVPQGRVDEFEGVSISGFSCTLIRGDVFEKIGEVDESFPACEDSDLWIRILSEFCMVGINEVLYDRMVHEDQTIKDDRMMVEGKRRLLEKHGDRLSQPYQITQRRVIARGLIRLGRYSEARSELREVIKADPRMYDYYYFAWLIFGATGYRIGRLLHRGIYSRLRLS